MRTQTETPRIDNHNPSKDSTEQAALLIPEGERQPELIRPDYRQAAARILKEIRRHAFGQEEEHILLFVLERSYMANLHSAPLTQQDDICHCWGGMKKTHVSATIGELIAGKVLLRLGRRREALALSFRPPPRWEVGLRGGEGYEAERSRVDARLDALAEQIDMKLFELDAEMADRFIAGVTPQVTQAGLTLHVTRAGVTPQVTQEHSRQVSSESLSLSVVGFSKPTLQEVLEKGRVFGLGEEQARKWYDALEKNGWRCGRDKTLVNDWTALLQNKVKLVKEDHERRNRKNRASGYQNAAGPRSENRRNAGIEHNEDERKRDVAELLRRHTATLSDTNRVAT